MFLLTYIDSFYSYIRKTVAGNKKQKSMYTMMAKAEEVTQSMKVVEGHAARIKDIKRLVDLFESFI